MRFLLWNINRKPLQSLIAAIVEERNVDVVLLAENTIPLVPLLTSLNKDNRGTYTLAPSTNRKIHVFSRLPDRLIPRLSDHGGISIRRLIPPDGRDIVLVGAHLPSKLYDKEVDQTLLCARIRRLVEEQEERVGHTRTLIMGDLNLNPFEPGAVAADGFHGVMSRRIAQKQSRTVDGKERHFFYNPMWGKFGDATPGPPGTCYYGPTGQISCFWNMFDQVLVRPDLLTCCRDDDVEVLTRAGSVSLLTEEGEVPDRETASDHLPQVWRFGRPFRRCICKATPLRRSNPCRTARWTIDVSEAITSWTSASWTWQRVQSAFKTRAQRNTERAGSGGLDRLERLPFGSVRITRRQLFRETRSLPVARG